MLKLLEPNPDAAGDLERDLARPTVYYTSARVSKVSAGELARGLARGVRHGRCPLKSSS